MAFSELDLMQGMTAEQRMLFQSQYTRAAKNRTTAFLLTLFLGGIGGHRFYLGQIGWGVVYLLFCVTLIPAFAAFIELFLIGKRTDRYNEAQAQELSKNIKMLSAAAQA